MRLEEWTHRLFNIEFVVLAAVLNSCVESSMASLSEIPHENSLFKPVARTSVSDSSFPRCNGACDSLPVSCYNCSTGSKPYNCSYGQPVFFTCSVLNGVDCSGAKSVQKEFQCRYCFLTTPNVEHDCYQTNTSCKVIATPRQRVKATCVTRDYVFCLGNRNFTKMVPCNWTSGYSWSAAFILSITLGGFGVDRFYLGHWKEGLGKFFSFGGLGVWTMVDVVLIGTGYLGPADGSLYVH